MVIQQINCDFAVKEQALARYQTCMRKLLSTVENFTVEHVKRQGNKYADALATLGAKINLVEETTQLTII